MATFSKQPEGYNTLSPYLIVSDARDAVKFYSDVFGGILVDAIEMDDGRLGHAELIIGDTVLMLGSEFPELGFKSPFAYSGTPVSIHLYIDDVDDVVAHALDAGAQLKAAVEDKFYGDRLGVIIDPWGHHWSLATRISLP